MLPLFLNMKKITKTWVWIIALATFLAIWVAVNYSWQGGLVYSLMGGFILMLLLNYKKFIKALQ